MNLSDIELFVIDLFCGAGGLSEGVEEAILDGKKCAKVVCCVDYDKKAILSHEANMPDALHFAEDIRTLELSPIRDIVNRIRKLYPDSKIMLHASLECTNFSKAKGGKPRDLDSRTLAEHLFRYIDVIDPDYIQIENVEEFMTWGEIDENGKPIAMDKGNLYQKWVCNVKKYGYNFDHRILNAADFGAYTTRKRFFGIFAKEGLPIVFPKPTHCKEVKEDMFTKLEKWRPVKEVLDFSDVGTTIFRDKPLAENTLKRIYAGLIKFVAGGKDAFVTAYYGNGNNHSVEQPAPTVTTKDRFALIQICFIDMQYGNGTPASINVPACTVTVNPKFYLVTCTPRIMNTASPMLEPASDIPSFIRIGGGGVVIYEIYDTDSPMTVKIKEFMNLYGIEDIKMRMFRIPELKRIMGFPEDYVLVGTQADQKKFIGNAVEVTTAKKNIEALCMKLRELIQNNHHFRNVTKMV